MSKIKTIIVKFQNEINALSKASDQQVIWYSKAISVCAETLEELHAVIKQEGFSTPESEIQFFKEIKPLVMSHLIYYSQVRSCEIRKPRSGSTYQTRFLKKQIKKTNKFFNRNLDFSLYMEMGYTYLDGQLFRRLGKGNFPWIGLLSGSQDATFTTSHDMLLARIHAMRRYLQYLTNSIETLAAQEVQRETTRGFQGLIWTGSKTGLTELIYALYSEKSVNHGNACLQEITACFESIFNVKLENIYKTYSEIKGRKGSKTKFLEELILSLQAKINREDGI